MGIDVPMDFDDRIRAVQVFRSLPQAGVLAENNKRVANILAKADVAVSDAVDEAVLVEAAEKALFDAVKSAQAAVLPLQAAADYQAILTTLASLSDSLTAFFDDVMVNSDDAKLKANRLALLQQVRNLFMLVADISLLQG